MTDRLARDILDGGPARRRSPDHEVWMLGVGPSWKLFRGFRQLEQTKRALLAAVWDLGVPLFFMPPEEPIAPELQTFLREQGKGVWRIVTSRPSDDFYATEPASGLGNWTLYASVAAGPRTFPDTFRTPPAAVLDALRRQQVLLLVDCFHDDTDWCIALNPDEGAEHGV